MVILEVTGTKADKSPRRRPPIVMKGHRMSERGGRNRCWLRRQWRRGKHIVAGSGRMSVVHVQLTSSKMASSNSSSIGICDRQRRRCKVCLVSMALMACLGRCHCWLWNRMKHRAWIRVANKQIEAEVGGDEARPLAQTDRHRVETLSQMVGQQRRTIRRLHTGGSQCR